MKDLRVQSTQNRNEDKTKVDKIALDKNPSNRECHETTCTLITVTTLAKSKMAN